MTTDGLPRRLSPTSIDRWRECPRRFFYQDVQRREFEDVRTYEQTLGEVVHKVLERLFRLPDGQRSLETVERELDLALLRFTATPSMCEGTSERMRAESMKLLSKFLATAKLTPDVLKTEATFQLRLKNGTTIHTRVDRIDRSESELLQVIDYKTGRVEVDERDLAYETSAIVQLLAVSTASEIPVDKVSWLYLRSGQSITWWPEPDDVDFATDRLIKVLRNMHRDREFEPNPGVHCVSCPFAGICPAWDAGEGADAVRDAA